MKNLKTKDLVGITLFATLIVIMAAIPQLGYIKLPILALDITLLFIPVLIGTTIYGKNGAIILGLAFGLSSLAVAIFRPVTPFDLLFRNPFVSVLPRVIFPVVYLFLLKSATKIKPIILSTALAILFVITLITFIALSLGTVAIVIAAVLLAASVILIFVNYKFSEKKLIYLLPSILSILVHSILVLSMLGLFYSGSLSEAYNTENIMLIILTIIASNSIFEAAFSSIIIQLVMPAVKRASDE